MSQEYQPSEEIMPFIKTIEPESATGALRKIYDEAIARSGKVWNVVQIMSIHPEVMQASMGLYMALMHQPSTLSRAQREMIATVVSRANNCYY